MNLILVGIFALLALIFGILASVVGGGITVLILVAILPFPLILKDYRIGVVLLTLLLAGSTMLPNISGLNVLTYVTVATIASFVLNVAYSKKEIVWLPRVLFVGLVFPATMAIAIAQPHIREGIRNYPLTPDALHYYDPMFYTVSYYVKPLFYYLTYGFLLANAVRSSKRPELFFVVFALAALVPAVAVLYTVATYPGTLLDVSRNREYLDARGLHSIGFGMLLALASGPLLFLLSCAKRPAWRFLLLTSFALVSIALVLTFSRGALLAYIIIFASFLLHFKRVKTVIASAVVVAIVMFAAPEALQERFQTGLHSGALSDVDRVEKDDLTAGRVSGWILLFPEVLENPLFGRGLGSTQWSRAAAAGRYGPTHPHNVYLELLMDCGLVGFSAFAFLIYSCLRRFGALAANEQLSVPLREFFRGSKYSLIGVMVLLMTAGGYMPNPAQMFFWFSLGFVFAYWKVAIPSRQTELVSVVDVVGRPTGAPSQSTAIEPVIRFGGK